MTNTDFTCPGQVQEPKGHDKTIPTRQAKVLVTGYPPLKSNPGCGAWRNVPWINLRGHWLKQAGFAIGTPYTIEVYEGKLVFVVAK